MKDVLKLTPPTGQIPDPPPDHGRLMNAEEVAAELFDGQVTYRWVKTNIHAGRVRLGYSTVRWFEKPVRAWIAERMNQEAV